MLHLNPLLNMFVTRIELGSRDDSISVENPTWDCAREAIESLNGKERDSVILEGEGDQYLGVSGGNEGRYVVGGYHEDFGSFLAACGPKSQGTLEVSVSGDYNPFSHCYVINLQKTIELARVFFESGSLKEDGNWMSQ